MILIYGKWRVWNGVAKLCDFLSLSYTMAADGEEIDYSHYEYIIPSPGIPVTHEIYSNSELRIKVISELDFAYYFLPKGFTIASITGTDGKSTTAWILYELFRKEYGSAHVYLSGNFDMPFSETVCDMLASEVTRWYIVLEISSFMSYGIGMNPMFSHEKWVRKECFHTDYSIFTNFERDHQNWHTDMQEYLDAKMNLMHHTTKTIVANTQIVTRSKELNLQCIFPENTRFIGKEWNDRTDGENIIISGRRKYKLSETHFSGFHNAMNILACTVVTNGLRICSKRTKWYLASIQWLPHRIELVTQWNGITFIDDSKSTSAQSLEAALSSFEWKKILLIAGWSDKGDSFEHLTSLLFEKVKAMACIGATKWQFVKIATKIVLPHVATDSLEEAVQYLISQASEGDVVLLSPGCASFGLFKDYLDRANQFRSVVQLVTHL